jgi:hypothetical protein
MDNTFGTEMVLSIMSCDKEPDCADAKIVSVRKPTNNLILFFILFHCLNLSVLHTTVGGMRSAGFEALTCRVTASFIK